MRYSTKPKYLYGHLFDGDIQKLNEFLAVYEDAYAMEMPNPPFKDTAMIVAVDPNQSLSLKVQKDYYVYRTDYDWYYAEGKVVFEESWEVASEQIDDPSIKKE